MLRHVPLPNIDDRDADGDRIVCKLKKSLYGLRQAAREWAEKLAATLLAFGCKRSEIDTCLFSYDVNGAVLHCLVYVDDLILAYSSIAVRDAFVTFLKEALPIDDRGELDWVLRMQIQRDRAARVLVLSQTHYLDKLLDKYSAWLDLARRYDAPLDSARPLTLDDSPKVDSDEWVRLADRRTSYVGIVGALLWLAGGTRPDIAFATSSLARYVWPRQYNRNRNRSFKKTKHVLRHAFWLRDVVARCLLQPTFVPGLLSGRRSDAQSAACSTPGTHCSHAASHLGRGAGSEPGSPQG